MKPVTAINVALDFGQQIHAVGRLFMKNESIHFQYDRAFLDGQIQLSPFHVPLQEGAIALPCRPFEGLAGVFNDSLPDGWGRLLYDLTVQSKGSDPKSLSPLDRLAQTGHCGMGALIYEPNRATTERPLPTSLDPDNLAKAANLVLNGKSADLAPMLLELNGSAAGARPKALIGLSPDKRRITIGDTNTMNEVEQWLVKFPNQQDGSDAGAVEYIYSMMAKRAGIDIPETYLFPSKNGRGFFAAKRFDRPLNKRYHMHSVSGLLHSDFRVPALDYADLLKLTALLTKDAGDVQRMFRLAVFNVLAHNRDDHAKNFSFLMNETGKWQLAPAYDITFSHGPGGEQSTTVLGEGKHWQTRQFMQFGEQAGLSLSFIKEVIGQTKTALSDWKKLATEFDIDTSSKRLINNHLSHSLMQFC